MVRITGNGKTCLANQLYLDRMRNTPRNMSDSAKSLLGVYGGANTEGMNSVKKNPVSSEIQKAAAAVGENCKNLTATGTGSLLEQALSSKDTKSAVKEVNSFVENYNAMVEKLKESKDSMDQIYAKQLKADGEKYKEQLASIGIAMKEDGTLAVDQKILEGASAEEIKKALGGSDTFTGAVAIKSIYIEANAALSGTQGSFGSYNNYNNLLSYSSEEDGEDTSGYYFNYVR